MLIVNHTEGEPDDKGGIYEDAVAEAYTWDFQDEVTVDNSCDSNMDFGEIPTDTKPESCDTDEERCIEIKPVGDCLNSPELIPIEVKFEGQGSKIHLWKRCDNNVSDVDIRKDTQEKHLSGNGNNAQMCLPQDRSIGTKSALQNFIIDRMKSQKLNNFIKLEQTKKNGDTSNGSKICKKKVDRNNQMQKLVAEKYVCSVCGKRYKEKGSLTKHNRSHSGEKPFTCHVCGVGFTLHPGLTRHMRTHTGEKPYACDVCEKRFGYQSALTTHMRIHTQERPYTCNTCGKGFKDSGTLRNHIYSHSNKKPHTCSVCGKGFAQQGGLVTHKRIHNRDRPYTCNTCGKGFTLRSGLNRHLKAHINKKTHTSMSLKT